MQQKEVCEDPDGGVSVKKKGAGPIVRSDRPHRQRDLPTPQSGVSEYSGLRFLQTILFYHPVQTLTGDV